MQHATPDSRIQGNGICENGIGLDQSHPWDFVEALQLHHRCQILSLPWEFAVAVSILLVCAVLASLTAGVLVAYGLCILMFRAFHIHSTRVAATRSIVAAQIPIKN